jgi:hypothetical protein
MKYPTLLLIADSLVSKVKISIIRYRDTTLRKVRTTKCTEDTLEKRFGSYAPLFTSKINTAVKEVSELVLLLSSIPQKYLLMPHAYYYLVSLSTHQNF